ncbi:carbohydrate kinase family protein [Coprothermobacter proteolyticus]|uniref:carbohydrate kinase family protein n=1 Tax=Coprothermobacter proteolyticus TaxID=35786 RepID=UPI001F21F28B|nr:carbohydrate kinase family protein [Coprothermobacter proteolyticus]
MVLIYGDVLMDVLIFEEAPKVYASDAQAKALVVPGGSAFNTARHVARCGANVGILGCVGTDGGYGFFMDAGQRYGINMLLTQKEGFTGTLLVRHEQGERNMWSSPNVARSYVAVPDVDIDWLHISGYALFHQESAKVVQELTVKAKSSGAVLSVDAASYEPLKQHLSTFLQMTRGYDFLFANEHEMEILAKTDYYYKHVVVKQGSRGATVDGVQVEASRVEVVSTLGAGDCFNGVFIAEVSKGTALVDACRKASEEASRWVATDFERRYF